MTITDLLQKIKDNLKKERLEIAEKNGSRSRS